MTKRKRMIDRTVPDVGQILIEKHGLKGAQRLASDRGDFAKTELTANFYERVHHWIRMFGSDLAAELQRSAPPLRSTKKARELEVGDLYSFKGRSGPPRRVDSVHQVGVHVTVAYTYRVVGSGRIVNNTVPTKQYSSETLPFERFHTNKILELYTEAEVNAR